MVFREVLVFCRVEVRRVVDRGRQLLFLVSRHLSVWGTNASETIGQFLVSGSTCPLIRGVNDGLDVFFFSYRPVGSEDLVDRYVSSSIGDTRVYL